MAHVGQELALGPVGVLGGVAGLAQRAFDAFVLRHVAGNRLEAHLLAVLEHRLDVQLERDALAGRADDLELDAVARLLLDPCTRPSTTAADSGATMSLSVCCSASSSESPSMHWPVLFSEVSRP